MSELSKLSNLKMHQSDSCGNCPLSLDCPNVSKAVKAKALVVSPIKWDEFGVTHAMFHVGEEIDVELQIGNTDSVIYCATATDSVFGASDFIPLENIEIL